MVAIILSKKEQKIYDCLVNYTLNNLYPPSIREICDMTGIKSTSSVYHMLQKLQKKELIQCETGISRAIKINGYKLIKE